MQQDLTATQGGFVKAWQSCIVSELRRQDESEVLEYLAARPIHTVFMTSLILDNGLVSPNNRGSFYACRNSLGQLEGVALLGHAMLIETQSEHALATFARLARNCRSSHLVRGERTMVNHFWQYYGAPEPRKMVRELLLEKHDFEPFDPPIEGLRPATLDDLERVCVVNSSMAFAEGGVSPLQSDPSGFRYRNARRIEQGRVWVWVHDQRLIFKADLICETPEVAYLEGIHVHAEERGQGHAFRCLNQLSSILLRRSRLISLTVNLQNKSAYALYSKAGFNCHSFYKTIYLS